MEDFDIYPIVSAKLVGVSRHSPRLFHPLNLRLLSIGASAYGGLIVLSWTRQLVVYIPATTAIVPSMLLTGIGITATALGLASKGRASLNRIGILMISSFFLGVFGFISWYHESIESYHTADVCAVSRLYPDGAEWACPQVQAANQIMWTLAVSLVMPALLFLVAAFLVLLREHSPPCKPPVLG